LIIERKYESSQLRKATKPAHRKASWMQIIRLPDLAQSDKPEGSDPLKRCEMKSKEFFRLKSITNLGEL